MRRVGAPGRRGELASNGTAINDNGQVADTSETSTGAEDGFSRSNGTMTDLGSNFTSAAVNDSGVIVGGQFVYNGTLQNLNTLIPQGAPTRSNPPPGSAATARSSPTPPARPTPCC